jgi:hypothetical protein
VTRRDSERGIEELVWCRCYRFAVVPLQAVEQAAFDEPVEISVADFDIDAEEPTSAPVAPSRLTQSCRAIARHVCHWLSRVCSQ